MIPLGAASFGSRGPRQVWALASVGIVAALITLVVFSHALAQVVSMHSRLTDLQDEAGPLFAGLEQREALQLASISRALAGETSAESLVLEDTTARSNAIMHFRDRLMREAPGDRPVKTSSAMLLGGLYSLDILARDAARWLERSEATGQQCAAARAEAMATLAAISAEVASAQGRARLARLTMVNKYRRAPDDALRAIADELVLGKNASADLLPLQTELADLQLLVEQLTDLTSIDQLANMRDNRITPSLLRLRQFVGGEGPGTVVIEGMNAQTVAKLAQGLFGRGYSFEAAQANREGEGLFRHCLNRISEKHDAAAIRERAIALGIDLRIARQYLQEVSDKVEHRLSKETTEALDRAWIVALTVTVISSAVFLGLGLVISRAIRSQALRLDDARLAAQAASLSKSQFLANMSHEIRTPMTAMLGYADLLLEPDQSRSDRMEHIQTIRRNGEHLLSIINDILDVSKIEAGQMAVESIDTSPVQIVEEVLSLMQVQALPKGIALRPDYAFPLPARIKSDPVRLRQILVNLVGNAIKFTEHGSVTIRTSLDPASSMLRFEIIDTGIGMNPEQLARLFKAFGQADSTMTRKYGGTGLGLTISKHLSQMLGGDVTVSSESGKGSVFTASINAGPSDRWAMLPNLEAAARHTTSSILDKLSFGAQATAKTVGQPVAGAAGLTILLAEDGLDNQRLITFHLRKAGAKVQVVENGRLAVEAALKAKAEGAPFDVVLMDMQMPELDGYSATSLLRAKRYAGPILALTAHAMAGDRERCEQSGCNDYLTKPISREALIDRCVRWAAINRPAPAAFTGTLASP